MLRLFQTSIVIATIKLQLKLRFLGWVPLRPLVLLLPVLLSPFLSFISRLALLTLAQNPKTAAPSPLSAHYPSIVPVSVRLPSTTPQQYFLSFDTWSAVARTNQAYIFLNTHPPPIKNIKTRLCDPLRHAHLRRPVSSDITKVHHLGSKNNVVIAHQRTQVAPIPLVTNRFELHNLSNDIPIHERTCQQHAPKNFYGQPSIGMEPRWPRNLFQWTGRNRSVGGQTHRRRPTIRPNC